MKEYFGYVPPCGIFCGGCPRYNSGKKNSCSGAESHCKERKCKSIYVCCVEKKGLEYCHQCKAFPCSRFKKFSESWKQYGEDLIDNQKKIEEKGVDSFLEDWNEKVEN